jgi:hypothetical protein
LGEDYLNLPRKNLKYYGRFSTDGVSCSIRFFKPQKHDEQQEDIDYADSDSYVGLDPGLNLFLGGVETSEPYSPNYTNVKYKSTLMKSRLWNVYNMYMII